MTKNTNRKPGVVIVVPGRAERVTSNEVLVADYIQRIGSAPAAADSDDKSALHWGMRELGHLARNASWSARVIGAKTGRYGLSVYTPDGSYHLRFGI